jgi:hypothetical protein
VAKPDAATTIAPGDAPMAGNGTAGAPATGGALASGPAPAAAAVPATGAKSPFDTVDVQLARVAEGREPERLVSPATTRIGDRLRIGISTDRELHVYAFNQEAGGVPTVMFPLAVLDTGNPLPGGEHELPGTIKGEHQSYTVESRAPHEDVMLVLATAELPALREWLQRLDALSGANAAPRAAAEAASLDAIAADARAPGVEVAVHRWQLQHPGTD